MIPTKTPRELLTEALGAQYIVAAALIQEGLQIYFDTMPHDHAKRATMCAAHDFIKSRSQ